MIIRAEHPDDIPAIRAIHLAAFTNGPEADIVDQLRTNNVIILSLIAMDAHKPAGHILFTEAKVDGAVLAALAPMAVLPEYQNRGIGRLLIQDGIERIKSLDYPGLIVLGHPAYYSRFGFKPASEWNIQCEYQGVPDEAFMAIIWDGSALSEEATAHFRPEFQAAL